MIVGAVLAITGLAFVIGAACEETWGPVGASQFGVYLAGICAVAAGACWPIVGSLLGRVSMSDPSPDSKQRRKQVSPRTRTAPDDGQKVDETSLLSELVQLAEMQLTESHAAIREQNTYALGLAALGATMISIVVAAQAPLGARWWSPIPGLILAIVIAALGSSRIAEDKLGPDPKLFYDEFQAKKPPDALVQLVADLRGARLAVPAVLSGQRRMLNRSILVFVLTAIYSTVVIAV